MLPCQKNEGQLSLTYCVLIAVSSEVILLREHLEDTTEDYTQLQQDKSGMEQKAAKLVWLLSFYANHLYLY